MRRGASTRSADAGEVDAVGAPRRPRRRAVRRAGRRRRRRAGGARGARRPGAAAQAAGARGDRRRDEGACRTSRTSPSSTRRSTARSRPRRRRTRCPARWRDEWGIRRYGFHGLSVQWAAEQVRVDRGSSSATSAAAARCRPCATAARSTRRWASARSRACRWRRAPARSTPRSSCICCGRGKLGVEEIERALESESGLLGLSGSDARRRAGALDGAGREARARRVRASRRCCGRVDGRRARRHRRARLHGRDRRGLARTSAPTSAGGSASSASSSIGRRTRVPSPTSTSARRVPPVRVVVLHAREDVVAARAARALLR